MLLSVVKSRCRANYIGWAYMQNCIWLLFFPPLVSRSSPPTRLSHCPLSLRRRLWPFLIIVCKPSKKSQRNTRLATSARFFALFVPRRMLFGTVVRRFAPPTRWEGGVCTCEKLRCSMFLKNTSMLASPGQDRECTVPATGTSQQ